MPEPTIDELLEVAFKIDPVDILKLHLEWPDDFNGQRSVIRHLAGVATTTEPGIPHHWRVWAFDKLREIGRDYLDRGAQVPPELTVWGFGVWTGKIKPPKRPRKRPATNEDIKKTIQNGFIVKSVNWLREQGDSRTVAIDRVHKASGLSHRRVADIYDAASPKK